MQFSYYYDAEKSHLLNCGIDIQSLETKTDGTVEAIFTAYIEEIVLGMRIKREQVTSTFMFPLSNGSGSNHDMDFLRHRYADERKWVFEIRNNKNSGQRIVLGLISNTALTNPLGLDIKHKSEDYNAEVRANNLSRIEEDIDSPLVRQTMAESQFSTIGYPRGFSSFTAKYDSKLQLIDANEFKQEFLEDIPEQTAFKIELNIAPYLFELKYPGDPVTTINIPNLVDIFIYKDRFVYVKENGVEETIRFDKDLEHEDLYLHGFKPESKLLIEGDGRSNLIISYGGKSINTVYNSNVKISELEMRGGITLQSMNEAEDLLPENWATHKIDNMLIFYTK